VLGAARRTRLFLVLVVCAGHVALIAGFNHGFALGRSGKTQVFGSKVLAINFRQNADKQFAEVAIKPIVQTALAGNKENSTTSTSHVQTPLAQATPAESSVNNRDYFLDSDKVDITAQPDEDFASRLASLLPLTAQNLVLEFWIEKDGQTIEVRCVEGECDSDVLNSLAKLTGLAFTPATKNGVAVANRKVIQIERKPNSVL
jgi:hypothetical protein